MNLDEAVKRACEKPTLLDALSYICVWDCDRAVKQALEHQKTGVSTAAEGGWDTCFKVSMKAVMNAWGKRGAGIVSMELQRGDTVEVVRPLSTYHPVGSTATVRHVSERGDFSLTTGNAATPTMSYGFAYRPCVKVTKRGRIPAIPTMYKGRQYRSRLEARWACFFDLMGWRFEYEPFDLNGYIPDFILIGEKRTTIVEVKPIERFDQGIADKMEKAVIGTDKQDHELLIVGSTLFTDPVYYAKAIGWMGEHDAEVYVEGVETAETNGVEVPPPSWWWEPAVFGWWKGQPRPGFCHSVGCYYDRISGQDDGGSFGEDPRSARDLAETNWAKAGNTVQWKPPR